MAANELTCVVLAAGKGTRLKSKVAKVLHRAGGMPLIENVIRACKPLGGDILVVVGHQAEDVRAAVTPFGASTVLQRPQNGTGHAMLIARAAIGVKARLAIVLPGDAPLIRTETLSALFDAHREEHAAATILTAELNDPAGYGRIVRTRDGTVSAIVEEKSANDSERKIREVNSSIYCFTLEKLWPCLAEVRPENAHRELYLTDAIAELKKRERVVAVLSADAKEILGCNTRRELAEADRVLRARKAAALMDAGVAIYLPETVLIDAEVEVGADSVIEPGVQLLGKTSIGPHCRIQSGSILSDAVIEHHVLVRAYSVITGSRLSAGAMVGPFAHLREGAELRAGARVGNFVEVKKSVLGEGVKAMHLTYLGDATIGRESNIGAGTITCNYDGLRKNPTRIGERVFVGSDSALVAPVTVGDGAYIAAGSTVTENVPADALAIARGRQVNKPGWALERRKRMLEQSSQIKARSEAANGADAADTPKTSHRSTNRKPSSNRKKKSRR
ncbi:MAG TPA: bifunctional UDP-N-acetylglucosamine diphosphorylase/glucosamine-1-phosphate N-acetyltransferase GlmU [Candidatus Acidoferrales bacterium]|nr:bifunctional UDP-N-acetylglucosamine diphosphorylase/glucosamine-1-phosphate N-acetyltransferase GlmU [Candidatus Acidoferrales bacterium]